MILGYKVTHLGHYNMHECMKSEFLSSVGHQWILSFLLPFKKVATILLPLSYSGQWVHWVKRKDKERGEDAV